MLRLKEQLTRTARLATIMFSIHSLYTSPVGNPYATGTDLGVDSNGALCLQPVFPQNEFYHQLQTRAGNFRNIENFSREPQLELKSIISPENMESFLSRNSNQDSRPDNSGVVQCHGNLQSDDKLKDINDDTISLQNIVSNRNTIGAGNNTNTMNNNNNNNNSTSSISSSSSNSNNNSPVNQNWEEKPKTSESNNLNNNNNNCNDIGCSSNTNDENKHKLHPDSNEEGTNCWVGDGVIKEEKSDGIAVGGLGWSGTGVVDVKVERGESKAFKCHLCRKAFSRRANLRNHERAHWNGKQHACPHCGKLFSHRAHLVIHERTHTGEKPFLCPVCPKHFAQKVHLQNHARTHTGEKPYRCRFCSKAFARRDHLNNHERIHTGEKPFTCARCSKSFTQRGHLKNHQRTHTGEAPFKCTMCSKAFVQRSHLNNHERTHNNSDITNGAGCGSSNSSTGSVSSNSVCSQHGCKFRVGGDRSHCHQQDERQDSGTGLCHDFSNCSDGGCFSCDSQPNSSIVIKVEAKSFDECDEIDGEQQQQQQCNQGNGCHYNNCNCTQLQHLSAQSHNSCNCGCNPLPSCHHNHHHTPQLFCSRLNHATINCNPDGFVTTCKKEVFDSPQDDAKRHDASQSDVRTFTYDICKKVMAQKSGLKKCKNTSTGEVLYSALNLLSGYNH